MKVKRNWFKWANERHEIYKHAGVRVDEVKEHSVDNKEIIRILQETLPEDAIITNDAGNFASWLHNFYTFNRTKTYIGPTSGAMGYGFPAAVGAKLAKPDKTVVSLSGDGGFMMTAQELETAVRYNIPVIALVFNNSMYGTIRMHQEMHYPKRVIGTELSDVNFSSLGTALGAQGFRVTTHKEFKYSLERALLSKGVTLIEIMTNPQQISVQSTIDSIREKSMQKA
jgi:acetolactate synthase-1/2/3 large subunit